jgi:hypothetical protein
VRGPLICRCAGHVDDREAGIDFSGVFCDFPPVKAARQIDIGYQSPVVVVILKQANGFFSRGDNF